MSRTEENEGDLLQRAFAAVNSAIGTTVGENPEATARVLRAVGILHGVELAEVIPEETE